MLHRIILATLVSSYSTEFPASPRSRSHSLSDHFFFCSRQSQCSICTKQPTNATYESMQCRDTEDGRHVRLAGDNGKALQVVSRSTVVTSGATIETRTQQLYAVREPYCFPVSASGETWTQAFSNDTSFTSFATNYFDTVPTVDSGLLSIPDACIKDPRCRLPPSQVTQVFQ
jgi:hypothetical protein